MFRRTPHSVTNTSWQVLRRKNVKFQTNLKLSERIGSLRKSHSSIVDFTTEAHDFKILKKNFNSQLITVCVIPPLWRLLLASAFENAVTDATESDTVERFCQSTRSTWFSSDHLPLKSSPVAFFFFLLNKFTPAEENGWYKQEVWLLWVALAGLNLVDERVAARGNCLLCCFVLQPLLKENRQRKQWAMTHYVKWHLPEFIIHYRPEWKFVCGWKIKKRSLQFNLFLSLIWVENEREVCWLFVIFALPGKDYWDVCCLPTLQS